MTFPVILSLIIIGLPVSWWLTGRIYHYALRHSILDHPGERSLHDRPIPRGGGLSIAVMVLLAVIATGLVSDLPGYIAVGLFAGGSIVAITGWIDDRNGLPALVRAISYLVASVLVTTVVLVTEDWPGPLGFIIMPGIVLALGWLTNLYNFMDGSDGFAAIEAITTGVFAAIIFSVQGEAALAALVWVISTAAGGFLIWNWPPARIFMGDVGSCLLGFMLGSLALYTANSNILPVTIWLILLSVFICDSSLTLAMRIFKREQWYQAHRQHAYQRLVQLGISHARLNYYLMAINLIIVYPAAVMALQYQALQWWFMLLVYLLLTGIWLIIQIKYSRQSNRVPT